MAYTGSIPCNRCEGTGVKRADDRTPCEFCRRHPKAISTGVRLTSEVQADPTGTCDRCGGEGTFRPYGICSACRGYGVRSLKDLADAPSAFREYQEIEEYAIRRHWHQDT